MINYLISETIAPDWPKPHCRLKKKIRFLPVFVGNKMKITIKQLKIYNTQVIFKHYLTQLSHLDNIYLYSNVNLVKSQSANQQGLFQISGFLSMFSKNRCVNAGQSDARVLDITVTLSLSWTLCKLQNAQFRAALEPSKCKKFGNGQVQIT